LWLARRRIGRGAVVAACFFVGTLVPALGFINVYPMLYSFVADHFQYLASLGVIAGGVAGMIGWQQTRGRPGSIGSGRAAGGVLLLVLGVLTWRQCQVYESRETLWRDTIAKNPTAWLAYLNLGVELERVNGNAEAIAMLENCLRLRPQEQGARGNLA